MAEDNMSKSLYTKYRPATIDEYKGDRIKNIVKKRFRKIEDMPHVIMVYGTRGTGKTTLCRILAKYYMCENPHEDGTPCEECDSCRSINEILIDGHSDVECPGVQEINASSVNGKSDISEIMEDAIVPPVYTKRKILIFDECHKITTQAQNAMLKIIEDIPEHLVVMFATTDPENVIPTIHSRCQLKIEARKQTVADMVDRLMYISEREKFKVSKQALEIIARKGDRIPRECINLLESIAKNFGEVTVDTVKEGTSDVDNKVYTDFIQSANKSLEEILLFNRKLKDNDIDVKKFLDGFIGFILDSLNIKHGISLDDYPTEYVKSVKALFNTYQSQDFDMLLQVVQDASRSISTSENSNELSLILLAMRISKIDMLSKGLSGEMSNAIEENKISMAEYARQNRVDVEEVASSYNTEINTQKISEEFEDSVVITDSADLMRKLAIGGVVTDESTTVRKEKELETNASLDAFFNN